MITKITGILSRVLDEEIRLQVGALEYQVLVPEFVRRRLQTELGREVTLCTSHYLEGNPVQGRMVPRLIGFTTEAELEFFDLFCTIDKVGVRKAMKAMARPIRDIAEAIHRQDTKWLTSLPGIGPATAEQAVAKLRRKVPRFTFMDTPAADGSTPATAKVEGDVLENAYQALLGTGLSPQVARERLDQALATGKVYTSGQELVLDIFRQPS